MDKNATKIMYQVFITRLEICPTMLIAFDLGFDKEIAR